jgi:hypothetical protein
VSGCRGVIDAAAPQSQLLRFSGEYFLYSEELSFVYGSGNIVLATGDGLTIQGDVLYFNVRDLQGTLYGHVKIKAPADGKAVEKEDPPRHYDLLKFKGFPFKYKAESFGQSIESAGEEEAFPSFVRFTPEQMKDYALVYEFRDFTVDKNRKIKARFVIPYVMGMPSIPFKRLTLKRGRLPEKTLLYFNSLNYTDVDGLSLTAALQVREPLLRGDFNLKLFEKEFFNLSGVKRGAIFSGKTDFLVKKHKIFEISTLLNSGEESFNVQLSHRQDLGFLEYSISQQASGRKGTEAFYQFSSVVTLKKLKLLVPQLEFTHNLKQSLSYRLSTPVNIWKSLDLRLSGGRKILRENVQSDTVDFSSSLMFRSSIFTLSSSYNFTRDMLQAVNRNNFSVNLNFQPLTFLDKNIALRLTTFYMYSAIPVADQMNERTTPGVNLSFASSGVSLPLGFVIQPSVTVNHIWDNRDDNFTDFNYLVALRRAFGPLALGVEYGVASRYRSRNFWVEGTNTPNLNLNLQLRSADAYDFQLRFFLNNVYALETISLNGQMKLPLGLRLSSFALFYYRDNRFQTVEVFLEKIFKNKVKIQGGYSLALKRFFIKFLLV